MKNIEVIGLGSPDTSSLVALCRKTGTRPETLFKAAFDYYEIREKPRDIRRFFTECMREGKLSVMVDNFCLDVLAGRTRLNPLMREPHEHHV